MKHYENKYELNVIVMEVTRAWVNTKNATKRNGFYDVIIHIPFRWANGCAEIQARMKVPQSSRKGSLKGLRLIPLSLPCNESKFLYDSHPSKAKRNFASKALTTSQGIEYNYFISLFLYTFLNFWDEAVFLCPFIHQICLFRIMFYLYFHFNG